VRFHFGRSDRSACSASDERRAATVLYRALQAGRLAHAAGEHEAERLRRLMQGILAEEPRAVVQYVSVADPKSLNELDGRAERALLSMAVYVGKTRLIDNLEV